MRLIAAALLSALVLSACSGGGAGGAPAPAAGEGGAVEGGAPSQVGGGAVEVGGAFTYPDGLQVGVGNWREEATDSPSPARVMRLDVTASNPTGEVVATTQAWVSVRAGDTGEVLEEWTFGPALDAVLQPGASTTASYSYDIPESPGHVTATVSWLEAPDPAVRPDVEFVVED